MDNETDLVVSVEVGQIWVSSSLVAGAHVEILSATNRPECWLVAVMSGQRPAGLATVHTPTILNNFELRDC